MLLAINLTLTNMIEKNYHKRFTIKEGLCHFTKLIVTKITKNINILPDTNNLLKYIALINYYN